MKLSVIIVNYNVKYFLEQCLRSVYNALHNTKAEVFVVDNNSADGSSAFLKKHFPQVKLIENSINVGFSKANNQAIRQASGEYILLLNPDTVVQENTFETCLHFMNQHHDAGALTVKMIDGKGRFLPESKRALPTPAVAFCKIFGLSKLFPKSPRFARYHLGHLDKHQIHSIEILPGAFMFMRKVALDKVGLLDESYFMYGEDIDLSYRFLLNGYKNYYSPETQIIHYKGESTKKGSINYVRIFYRAMIIFAKKHFSAKHARLFSALIHLAIYIRAFVAILHRVIKNITLPLLDTALFSFFSWQTANVWESQKYSQGYFPVEQMPYFIGGLSALFLLTTALSGGYQHRQKGSAIFKSWLIFSIIALIVYALLPEHWRISRFLIIGSSLVALFSISLSRLISHWTPGPPAFHLRKVKKMALVGNSPNELERVEALINAQPERFQIEGHISSGNYNDNDKILGHIQQLAEIVRVNRLHEIIFCAHDLAAETIISLMLKNSHLPVEFKIAQPDSMAIIGSNSISTAGELYTIENNSIGLRKNRIAKRVFDLLTSTLLIIGLPVLLPLAKKRKALVNNSIAVLLGCKTWVSYCKPVGNQELKLPQLKAGYFNPLTVPHDIVNHLSTTTNANLLYAKNFSIFQEFTIFIKGVVSYF